MKTHKSLENERIQMEMIRGFNKEIADGRYDEDLAVVCDNGTFVGREENQVRACKGIPYAMPPVGELPGSGRLLSVPLYH